MKDHPDTAVTPDAMLTAAQVALLLNVPRKRVYELSIPRVQYSPKCIRWRRSDVAQWVHARTHTITA